MRLVDDPAARMAAAQDWSRFECFVLAAALPNSALGEALDSLRDLMEFYSARALPAPVAPAVERGIEGRVGASREATPLRFDVE